MFDFSGIAKLKKGWSVFKNNHPRIVEFINNVRSKGAVSGQEIAIAIRYPDGTEFKTGIKLQDSDLEFIEEIKNLSKML